MHRNRGKTKHLSPVLATGTESKNHSKVTSKWYCCKRRSGAEVLMMWTTDESMTVALWYTISPIFKSYVRECHHLTFLFTHLLWSQCQAPSKTSSQLFFFFLKYATIIFFSMCHRSYSINKTSVFHWVILWMEQSLEGYFFVPTQGRVMGFPLKHF